VNRLIAPLVLLLALIPVATQAQPEEKSGPFDELRMATLGTVGPHQVWITALLARHSQLFDASSGLMLASLDSALGAFPKTPIFAATRNEYYVVEAKREWGHRGERTDFVTIYDATTLQAKGQIVIPIQIAESAGSLAYTALLDDNRTLALFSQIPNQKVSFVDLETRTFVGSIAIQGCAGIYATGARSFATLCGNGTMHHVKVDAEGNETGSATTTPFFEAVADPVMMNGVRLGDRWVFVSFVGEAHEVDFSQSPPVVTSWSMVSDGERKKGWRPGGRQLSAIHRELGRLYVLFHQGEAGSHKDPGPEVWVFDLASRERMARFELPNMDASAIEGMLGVEGGFSSWFLRRIIPASGADTVAVTQDAAPLLLVRNAFVPVLSVLDARSGAHVRDIHELGTFDTRLMVPQ
jgi:methylamine dehydrogenase heavy chain